MKKLLLLPLMALLCLSAPAQAQYSCNDTSSDCCMDIANAAPCCCCGFSVSAYAWFPWFTGDICVDGTTVDIDSSIGESIGDSSSLIPWILRAEYQGDCWGGYIDLVYGNLTFEDQKESSASPECVDVDLQTISVDFLPRYRVWQCGRRCDGCPCTAFDIEAGFRYASQQVTFDWEDGSESEKTMNWWEPLVGMRFETELCPCWDLILDGDVGGFGAGTKFSWHFDGYIRYSFCVCGCRGQLMGGYRGNYEEFDEDHESDRSTYKVTEHGPIVGIGFRF